MNAAVKRHRTLTSRLARVCNCLKERIDSACGLPHRQANEVVKRLSGYESEKTLGCTRRCGRIPMQTYDLPGSVPDAIARAGFAAGRRRSAVIHDRTPGVRVSFPWPGHLVTQVFLHLGVSNCTRPSTIACSMVFYAAFWSRNPTAVPHRGTCSFRLVCIGIP
jgi:hypothetical protein